MRTIGCDFQFETLSKKVRLMVALHHPIYSADVFHSGSTHMKEMLEAVVEQSGRAPDTVLAMVWHASRSQRPRSRVAITKFRVPTSRIAKAASCSTTSNTTGRTASTSRTHPERAPSDEKILGRWFAERRVADLQLVWR